MKKVLTIAGSDPIGGAGIQADLKTFMAHKVYGMSIITALTAQNTTGVGHIVNVSPDFLREQFSYVFEDIMPDAVKIGMVSELELIEVIVEQLLFYKVKNIVVDPVMVSTSGSCLLAKSALEKLINNLIPIADIITPNIREANVLAQDTIETKEDMVRAAEQIALNYGSYILIKGGHLKDCADDLLYKDKCSTWLLSKKLNNSNTHGTGCTLSSAIASNLALGLDMNESVNKAKAYIYGAIKSNLDLGKGRGPLNHCWNMR